MKIIPVRSLLQSDPGGRLIARFGPALVERDRVVIAGGEERKKQQERFVSNSFPRRGATRFESNHAEHGGGAWIDGRSRDLVEISIVLSRISKNNCTRLRSRRITERKVECGSKVREERSGRICHEGSRGKVYRVCDFHDLHLRAFPSFSCSFFSRSFSFSLSTLRFSNPSLSHSYRLLVLPRAFSHCSHSTSIEGVYNGI